MIIMIKVRTKKLKRVVNISITIINVVIEKATILNSTIIFVINCRDLQ